MSSYFKLNILNYKKYLHLQHHKLNFCHGKYIPSTGKYALHDIILYFMTWCASLTDQWVAVT